MRQIRLPDAASARSAESSSSTSKPEPLELRPDPVGDLALVPRLRRDLAQARKGVEQPLAHKRQAIRGSGFAADAYVFCVRGLFDRRLLGRRPFAARGRTLRRGADEVAEERLRARRARVELGVELRGDEERVVGQARRSRRGARRATCPSRPGPRPRAGAGAGCSPRSGGGGACR